MKESRNRLQDLNSELVIGIAGAVGSDLARVEQKITDWLSRAGYTVIKIKISTDVIPLFGEVEFQEYDDADRVERLMDAGDAARRSADDDGVLGLGAASIIASKRRNGQSLDKHAFIVNSLKRPEEVKKLREIYPNGFVMVGVFAEEWRRLEVLERRGISGEKARLLVERDVRGSSREHGQRLEDTFYLSDFFVKLDGNDDSLDREIRRIVELIFGYPFHTPTFDEYAMFFAFAAALRSADLSRQVGAVVARDRQVLSTGANDCPRFGGGLYWPEDDPARLKGRDCDRGYDSNRLEQSRIVDKLVELSSEKIDAEALRELLMSKSSPIRDLTEYGRVVHAEMDAITACARSGTSTAGATIYCTTFPCHNCAKHIVAAGITRVVYIEPYAKSKATQLHDDAIGLTQKNSNNGKVLFEPFIGIGPRRFFDLFSMNLSSGYDVVRKASRSTSGEKANWDLKTARCRIQMLPSTYIELEAEAVSAFHGKLEKRKSQDE